MNTATFTMFANPFLEIGLLCLSIAIAIRVVLWFLGKH